MATTCGSNLRQRQSAGSWGCSFKVMRVEVGKQKEGENRVESEPCGISGLFLILGREKKNGRTYSKYVKIIRGPLLFICKNLWQPTPASKRPGIYETQTP